MIETAVALVLGHVLGDFVLQTDTMVARKREARVMLLHVAIVTAATWIALGLPPAPWLVALIAVSHAAIDAAKLRWGGPGFRPFALDQAAHVAIIALGAALFPEAWAAGLWAGPAAATFPPLARLPEAMALNAGMVVAVWAGGHAVREMMTGVRLAAPDSLPLGGRLIGRLERLVILMLVLAEEPGAIGFLIAAKSILRFSELAREDDRHVSEYVIIGTLASFAWAIAAGYATRAALAALAP